VAISEIETLANKMFGIAFARAHDLLLLLYIYIMLCYIIITVLLLLLFFIKHFSVPSVGGDTRGALSY